MFRKAQHLVSSKAIAMTLLAISVSTPALAFQPPSTGLGQAWPNNTDVSVSPHYHAYVFARDGVRYIQVNDLTGAVLGAVAVVDNQLLVLPVGVDAENVTVSQAGSDAVKAASSSESVYSDDLVQITAGSASNGGVKLDAAAAMQRCTNPSDCTGNVISRIGN